MKSGHAGLWSQYNNQDNCYPAKWYGRTLKIDQNKNLNVTRSFITLICTYGALRTTTIHKQHLRT